MQPSLLIVSASGYTLDKKVVAWDVPIDEPMHETTRSTTYCEAGTSLKVHTYVLTCSSVIPCPFLLAFISTSCSKRHLYMGRYGVSERGEI